MLTRSDLDFRQEVLDTIAAFSRAKRRGDEGKMAKLAARIDALQRQCTHPPYAIDIKPARRGHPRKIYQVGSPLEICFQCNRLLAVMSAPYRYEHDTEESFQQVVRSLEVRKQFVEHAFSADPHVYTDRAQHRKPRVRKCIHWRR